MESGSFAPLDVGGLEVAAEKGWVTAFAEAEAGRLVAVLDIVCDCV